MGSLSDHLPSVRGKLLFNAPLAPQTWFGVGGAAEVLFHPADDADLADFLKNLPPHIPVIALGVASNVIIRDGGVPGVVVRLGPAFGRIKTDDAIITAGAAALDVNVAKAAQTAGLAGLEFLSGIPGTVGGGVRMNAGAYGRELKDVLISARCVDRSGIFHTLNNADCGFSYRHSHFPDDWIVLSAALQGQPDDKAAIAARMKEIHNKRSSTQPIREKTGGSTFANPDGHKAWQLIEAAGCRGLRVGGAHMSEMHCNFMINTGAATAHDLETLGEDVRTRVKNHSGVDLRWEIKRIGIGTTQR
ncbi:MAG: UDP-N-acetylmuramate dehydrogenase [Alphaproteobacteria bacterium]|nr:UDP-N-acetylmuramate dehydrogenase [Alphaproteobacteria bacterium]